MQPLVRVLSQDNNHGNTNNNIYATPAKTKFEQIFMNKNAEIRLIKRYQRSDSIIVIEKQK
jgi:hypothetical protein